MDRRSKTYKELIRLTPRSSDLLTEEIDGVAYGYKRESRCKVCNSGDPVRNLIDTLLLYPKTYREVLRLIIPLLDEMSIPQEDRPTYASIRVHQQRHLPFDRVAVREIVERRAKDKGLSILDGAERLLTAESFFEVIVQKTWDRLVNGGLVPSLAEGMGAMKVLHALEQEADSSSDMNRVLVQLNVVLEVIRQESSPEVWQRIVKRLEDVDSEKPRVEILSVGTGESDDEVLAFEPDEERN